MARCGGVASAVSAISGKCPFQNLRAKPACEHVRPPQAALQPASPSPPARPESRPNPNPSPSPPCVPHTRPPLKMAGRTPSSVRGRERRYPPTHTHSPHAPSLTHPVPICQPTLFTRHLKTRTTRHTRPIRTSTAGPNLNSRPSTKSPTLYLYEKEAPLSVRAAHSSACNTVTSACCAASPALTLLTWVGT